MPPTIESLVAWLQQQADRAGAVGAVVGLSGGVDSATAAALCARAFPAKALGVLMPVHSAPQDLEDARETAAVLGIETVTVDLAPAYDALAAQFAHAGHAPDSHRLAAGNVKPRLRMLTLYYFANVLNRLVVGTGNRSELYVGYFTKHGDGGVDVLPLGQLVKRRVRELARALGIPERIVERTPSAGLWPGQTDEGEMGLAYRDLDAYLLGETVPEAVRRRIEALHERTEHKRTAPPAAEP